MPITLTQPSIGSTDWGDDVNDNWQELLNAFNSGTVTIGPVNFANAAGNYLRLPQLTTVQRDDLTPENGMMIYNSDNDQFERYEDDSWGAFGGGSVTDVTASSPLASSGGTTPNISFTGTLAVANGGTGAGTADVAATNLGLGTSDSPQFAAVNLGHATDTTLSRVSPGVLAVEGNTIYAAGGIDVPLADGGTGASLSDPGADRLLFWDYTAGSVAWLTAGTGLTITGTTISATGGGGGDTVLYKPADESLASNTTLQDDDDLKITLSANSEYSFRLVIRIEIGSATPDIKVAMNGPASPSKFWYGIQVYQATYDAYSSFSMVVTSYDDPVQPNWGTAADTLMIIDGYIKTASDVNQQLVLRWCQRSSSATATIVAQGSTMRIRELS